MRCVCSCYSAFGCALFELTHLRHSLLHSMMPCKGLLKRWLSSSQRCAACLWSSELSDTFSNSCCEVLELFFVRRNCRCQAQ